jgi:hypothetical protein
VDGGVGKLGAVNTEKGRPLQEKTNSLSPCTLVRHGQVARSSGRHLGLGWVLELGVWFGFGKGWT